jgi:hypothetical protein
VWGKVNSFNYFIENPPWRILGRTGAGAGAGTGTGTGTGTGMKAVSHAKYP